MILQLAPLSDIVAARPAVPSRTRNVATRTVILEMHLQTAAWHSLVTVAIIRTHHRQLVQYFPDKNTAWFYLPLPYQLLLCRAGLFHPQVTLQAYKTEGVSTGCVNWVYQWLEAYSTQKLVVCVIRVVIQMVFSRLMALATAITHYDVAHSLDLEAVGLLQAAGSSRPLSLNLHLFAVHL